MSPVKHISSLGALALGLALAAEGASANTVSLSNILASWGSEQPSGSVSYAGNGTSAPTARWGEDMGSGRSGYDFVAQGTLPIVVDVPPSPSADFILGTFRHVNLPITGTAITGIRLAVSADVVIEGADQGVRTFVFDFTHQETGNGDNPCPFGGANNQGVNINGCADRVTVSFNNLSENFLVGSDTYTLAIRGFMLGGSPVTSFLTAEQAINQAQLSAQILLRSDVPLPPNDVPVPATLALLGLGLAGIAVRRRTPVQGIA